MRFGLLPLFLFGALTVTAVELPAPDKLPVSAVIRLKRLHPWAIRKEEGSQVIVPLTAADDIAQRIAALLRDLLPPSATTIPAS